MTDSWFPYPDGTIWFVVSTGERPTTLNAERKGSRWDRSAATALWKTEAGWALKSAGFHRLRFEAVMFEFTPVYTKGAMPDTGNVYPVEKAIVDAVVEAGVIPDDNRFHDVGHTTRPPVKWTEVGIAVAIHPGSGAEHECTCRSRWERSQVSNQMRSASSGRRSR